jgi:hypothetical protein
LTSDDDERAWVLVLVVVIAAAAAAADPSYGWIYSYQTKPENEISLLMEVFFLFVFLCCLFGVVVVVEGLILVCVFVDAQCHGFHYC